MIIALVLCVVCFLWTETCLSWRWLRYSTPGKQFLKQKTTTTMLLWTNNACNFLATFAGLEACVFGRKKHWRNWTVCLCERSMWHHTRMTLWMEHVQTSSVCRAGSLSCTTRETSSSMPKHDVDWKSSNKWSSTIGNLGLLWSAKPARQAQSKEKTLALPRWSHGEACKVLTFRFSNAACTVHYTYCKFYLSIYI